MAGGTRVSGRPSLATVLDQARGRLDRLCQQAECETTRCARGTASYDAMEAEARSIAGTLIAAFRGQMR